MRTVVLSCGPDIADAIPVGPLPGKDRVDELLDADRLVVHGTDADLAAVVLRLLRREKLDQVSVAYVPTASSSVPLRCTAETARTATAAPVPLIRDDAGGVLVGLGVAEVTDATVYRDSEPVLRGRGTVEVRPDSDPAAPGMLVTVGSRGVFGRRRTGRGRALQFGCAPMHPVCDGLTHCRGFERWTWYRHTVDLWLVGS